MNLLSVNLENCFGIHEFKQEFDFSQNNTVLIYAPNGIMKTSFAKTLECISKGNKKDMPRDLVYSEREPTYEILADRNEILPKSILVVNTDTDIDAQDQITTILASKDLKNEYDALYKDLNYEKKEFLKKLKDVSSSSDCESEILEAFKSNDLFFVLQNNLKEIKIERPLYNFKYNDVFDKKGNVEKFLNSNSDLLQQYVNNYAQLLRESSLFKTNTKGNSFGTFQANQILTSVSDDSFFDADHKISLSNGVEIKSKSEFEALINEEINKIFEDEELKKSFETIDKKIGGNTELRMFKSVIESNKSIIPELLDYSGFKRKVWYGYLHSLVHDIELLVNSYSEKRDKIAEILKKAKRENEVWKNIIEIYKKRFFVPFEVEIQNQEDIILKEASATLRFSYKDSSEESKEQGKENLLKVLSKGERRAFFILQFIFEIEARKTNNQETLLILDDIADSFDYKNKYAIIEYLKDIDDVGIFKQIILTHNFDFYRTVASRLKLDKNVFMALKDEERKIILKKGQYLKDVFNNVISKNAAKDKDFVSMIPFVRNIVEYTKGKQTDEYMTLTSCLHIKKSSLKITKKAVAKLFRDNIQKCNELTIENVEDNIIDAIKKTADNIASETNIDEILLENKLVLSIAIRLQAEEFMIKKLEDKMNISEIKKDQTKVLIDEFKKNYPDNENIKLLEEVNMITPENIHVNSFMYEPLIDLSVHHLKRLYEDIVNLNKA